MDEYTFFWNCHPWLLWDKDGEAGNGGSTPADGDSQDDGDDDSEETTPAAAQNTDTDDSDDERTVPYHRFKEINDELKQLRAQQAKAQKEAEQAEEERLAEQKKFEELAAKRQERIVELEPQVEAQGERLQEFENIVSQWIEAEIEEWPEEVTEMDPGEDADILERFQWLQKARKLANKLLDAPPAPGNGRKPKPAGSAGSGRDKEARKESRRFVRQNF